MDDVKPAAPAALAEITLREYAEDKGLDARALAWTRRLGWTLSTKKKPKDFADALAKAAKERI